MKVHIRRAWSGKGDVNKVLYRTYLGLGASAKLNSWNISQSILCDQIKVYDALQNSCGEKNQLKFLIINQTREKRSVFVTFIGPNIIDTKLLVPNNG